MYGCVCLGVGVGVRDKTFYQGQQKTYLFSLS